MQRRIRPYCVTEAPLIVSTPRYILQHGPPYPIAILPQFTTGVEPIPALFSLRRRYVYTILHHSAAHHHGKCAGAPALHRQYNLSERAVGAELHLRRRGLSVYLQLLTEPLIAQRLSLFDLWRRSVSGPPAANHTAADRARSAPRHPPPAPKRRDSRREAG